MVVDYLDDFGNLVSGIEILGNDRPAECGTLVGDKFALYVATGNGSDDNSAFFYKEGSIGKAAFGMVIQEFAGLQKGPVYGFLHHESVPSGFHVAFVGQNFVHIR